MPLASSGWIRRSRSASVRRGIAKSWLVGLFLLAPVLGFTAWSLTRETSEDEANLPLLTEVTRGPYEHIVLEQGEIESSNNVEIRCEVKNRSGGDSPSTTILEVIAEGTQVKEGDWLITFDSRALENELTQQTILVKTSETLVIQAKAAYETAVMAQREYLEGTYEQERKTIENEIFVAEEELKKAELSFDSIKRSVSRGLISPLQLEGEKFRVDAARKVLELANQKLHVLDNYTKEKMLTQMNSDIEAAKIQWENERASHQEELKKLREIEGQIAKCTVYAPQDGQVVYANVRSSRSGSEFVVEQGAAVRERQEILRLPDTNNMEVVTKINETRINLVKEGMEATIKIDALGEKTLRGVVTKVNKYAEPGNWWSSTAKEYESIVKIFDPPPQIRSGLTAEVRIHVENRDDALQLPVQAVLEHKGRTFCLVKGSDGGYQTREIEIKSTNDKVVALDESNPAIPQAGDQVVLNPRQHRERFDFSGFLGLDDPAESPEMQSPVDDSAEVAPIASAPTPPSTVETAKRSELTADRTSDGGTSSSSGSVSGGL